MHRVRAAARRGASHIEARFFDGSASAAFVLAVRANITHGLPLSLADRKAAALRILAEHPMWSTRRVAAATGLGRRTVAQLRERAGGQASQLNSRVGIDGRIHPLSTDERRLRAGELVRRRPDISLREIAGATGLSVGTARDVRNRVRQGDAVVPGGREHAPAEPVKLADQPDPRPDGADAKDYHSLWQGLARDPSLRLTESGRGLLRWLRAHLVRPGAYSEFIAAVPPHRMAAVVDLARHNARTWTAFLEELERHTAARGRPAEATENGGDDPPDR